MASPEHFAAAVAAGRHDDHADGLAFDITADPSIPMDALADALADDARVTYVIWNRRIRSRTIEPGVWREYNGPSPHTDHVHVSIREDTRNDASEWRLT